jgi:hypothetical protein
MSDQKNIERQINQVLAKETQAIPLSNQLFSPDGLFNQLARTEEERRIVAQSSLFKAAQKRLTELQQNEAAQFARAVDQSKAAMPGDGYRVKLERATRE